MAEELLPHYAKTGNKIDKCTFIQKHLLLVFFACILAAVLFYHYFV